MTMVLIAGLLPVAVLLFYIYSHDKIEKEPPGLIVKLLLLGCVSCIPAMILEMLWTNFLQGIMDPNSVAFILIENFLIVALAEEGSKRVLLQIGSWRNPAFNYVFDGVVYAVCVSLGFAGLENVLYIAGFGMDIAVMRGLAAVPLHCICGVFMGHYYGLEKTYSVRGMINESKNARVMGLLIPILIHGFYDFAATIGNETFVYIWLVFVVVIDIIAIRSIKKYSRFDTPI
ncbi:MAG: PrsW family intramembrane metalloprotease [Lachnospiraceae bacterium]|nr:PrsW family intramembrane metalloprotease [Lachnospiraceae bacterium]